MAVIFRVILPLFLSVFCFSVSCFFNQSYINYFDNAKIAVFLKYYRLALSNAKDFHKFQVNLMQNFGTDRANSLVNICQLPSGHQGTGHLRK
jgi:hypothetical protein